MRTRFIKRTTAARPFYVFWVRFAYFSMCGRISGSRSGGEDSRFRVHGAEASGVRDFRLNLEGSRLRAGLWAYGRFGLGFRV